MDIYSVTGHKRFSVNDDEDKYISRIQSYLLLVSLLLPLLLFFRGVPDFGKSKLSFIFGLNSGIFLYNIISEKVYDLKI